MAYTDLSSTFIYKSLLTWQLMDQLGENDEMFVRTDLGGQTITPASGVVGLTIAQTQVAHCIDIDNDSTQHGLYIHQDGVLASARYALNVYSNTDQDNAPLINFQMDNASSSTNILNITNDGTGKSVFINQAGNGIAAEIDNNGTQHGLYINQVGVNAASNNALFIYSNANQANAHLVTFHQDNASSAGASLALINDATGSSLNITNSGGMGITLANSSTDHGINISQNAVNATTKHPLYVYSNSAQVNADSALVKLHLDNASSTEPCLEIINDGSGALIEFSGNAATRYYALCDADFVPENESDPYFFGGATTSKIQDGDTSGLSLRSGVHLPHNAIVTSMIFYYYRDDATAVVAAELFRVPVGSETVSSMAQITGTGTSGFQNLTDSSISNATIDNQNYAYLVRATVNANDNIADVRFNQVIIVYTVTEFP